MTEHTRRRVRAGLVYLTASFLVVGLWATLAPSSFYDGFLDPEAAGTTLGAHVHVGPCLAGNGGAAGPHYNTGAGGPLSPDNEVWLDFTIRPGGVAYAYAVAPFEIAPGDAPVGRHSRPTHRGGDGPGWCSPGLPARAVLTVHCPPTPRGTAPAPGAVPHRVE